MLSPTTDINMLKERCIADEPMVEIRWKPAKLAQKRKAQSKAREVNQKANSRTDYLNLSLLAPQTQEI